MSDRNKIYLSRWFLKTPLLKLGRFTRQKKGKSKNLRTQMRKVGSLFICWTGIKIGITKGSDWDDKDRNIRNESVWQEKDRRRCKVD